MPRGVYVRSPETRANIAAAGKARWADPEKAAAAAAATAAGVRTPEARERISQAQKARFKREPQSDEHRAKNRAGQIKRWADKEARAHRAELSRALWADPAHRAHMKKVMCVDWEEAPEWLGPLLARREVVVQLRAQDGDLCQLCLEPIDFTLRWPQAGYPTLDHIQPRASGGNDNPDNLWLAHFSCNCGKGARFVGRLDGTTDRKRITA